MDGRIFHIRAKLSNDLGHHWSVTEMAQITDISGPHLIRLFRQYIGETPFEFLTHLRLDRARELLEATFLRVKQIGVQIGIPNESQFTREFKRRFGSTPTEYRRQHWELEQARAREVQE